MSIPKTFMCQTFRVMRHAKVAVLGAVLLALTGCGVADRSFTRTGIGPELYYQSVSNSTLNLNSYISYLCTQAALPNVFVLEGTRSCIGSKSRDELWRQVVYTGFNDIDQRCDNYLAWIDEVRNKRLFSNSVLTRAASLTNLVLATTGASVEAITIVAESFGFARGVFVDVERLIIPGIEGSTVKLIVSERRLKFRKEVAKTPIYYRADAVHLLQSYLRICMPHTITMSANAYARAEVLGTSVSNTVLGDDQVADTVLANARPQRADGTPSGNQGPGPKQGDPEVVKMFGKGSGRTPKDVIAVQERLCVSPTGKVREQTRTGIAIYRRDGSPPNVLENGEAPFLNKRNEFTSFMGVNEDCSDHMDKYMNIYEFSELKTKENLSVLVTTFNVAFKNDGLSLSEDVTVSSEKDSEFRKKIAEARAFLEKNKKIAKEQLYDGRAHLTPYLFAAIVRRALENGS